jgi:hypothetical protein
MPAAAFLTAVTQSALFDFPRRAAKVAARGEEGT